MYDESYWMTHITKKILVKIHKLKIINYESYIVSHIIYYMTNILVKQSFVG